jgi:D-alanine--poly(phosphoribitol) ligase subunit 1
VTASAADGSAPPPHLAGEIQPLPDGTVVDLIGARVKEGPSEVALEHRGETVSYAKLAAHSQAIASELLGCGTERGDLVALWADRTPATVAAALAIMSIGAAYAPIDPAYPADRVRHLLAAAGPRALLYDGSSVPPPSLPGIAAFDASAPARPPGRPSAISAKRSDLAYVVFTSGSTGAPKGVAVAHDSLLNYLCWCAELVGEDGCGAPLFASLGFDHAVTCLWLPLAQGKRVVLTPGVWDQEALFGSRRERFTFLKLTPSHARFFERLLKPDYATATALLMFGGEALDPAMVRCLGERLADVRLVNHYGPTEATVGCCWHEFDLSEIDGDSAVPIGRPIWNTRAYVVDEDLRPLAPGAAGELVLAGRCVADGYLDGSPPGGFVDEGLLGGPAGPAYRTGDVVECRADGALVYLGREDSQFKVSGHRIELGELRHHALAVPEVGEVAFDVVRGDIDGVEAFVVPDDTAESRERIGSAVRKALGQVLPPSVVPQEVHVVDELVFDSHGKCDLEATRSASRRAV